MDVLYLRELLWVDDAVNPLNLAAVALHGHDPNDFTGYPGTETWLAIDKRKVERRAVAIEALLKADNQLHDSVGADNRTRRRRNPSPAVGNPRSVERTKR